MTSSLQFTIVDYEHLLKIPPNNLSPPGKNTLFTFDFFQEKNFMFKVKMLTVVRFQYLKEQHKDISVPILHLVLLKSNISGINDPTIPCKSLYFLFLHVNLWKLGKETNWTQYRFQA